MMIKALCLALTLLAAAVPTLAQDHQTGRWGDLGDGRYRNPVLAGDYSDPDIIRVGRDFYTIASTINMSPGMAVLHSRDLVNWTTIGHVVEDISMFGPELSWRRMGRYGRGVYAGSIRHHEGVFYVHFSSFDEGIYVATATDPKGPWKVQPMRDGKGRPLLIGQWLDFCPLWDGDEAYIVASKSGSAWYPHLFRMSADGVTLLDADRDAMASGDPRRPGQGTAIYAYDSAEGSKLYKINGLYYFFNNQVGRNGRRPMMRRSRHIWGDRADGSPGTAERPGAYQVRQMFASSGAERETNQGGLVDTPDGQWFFLTHGGAGGYPDGRVSSLLPVRWEDGWPFPGTDRTGDGLGEITWVAPKPIMGFPRTFPQGSDGFDGPRLSPLWEWNHQPRDDKWSLTERRGWLRLKAFPSINKGGFFKAANTIGQRYMSAARVTGTMRFDISGMADGQIGGFAHFNGGRNVLALGVRQTGDGRRLVYMEDGRETPGPEIAKNVRYLHVRSVVDNEATNAFSYSFDGKAFTPFGGRGKLKWGSYRGDYMGAFTWNDAGERGWLDVDGLDYRMEMADLPVSQPQRPGG